MCSNGLRVEGEAWGKDRYRNQINRGKLLLPGFGTTQGIVAQQFSIADEMGHFVIFVRIFNLASLLLVFRQFVC